MPRNAPPVVTPLPAPTDLSQNPFYIHPSENPLNGLGQELQSLNNVITYITQQLSQLLSKPTQTHYNAAMRVLKYLKGCSGRGIYLLS